MKRLDICEPRRKSAFSLLLILQSPSFDFLRSRLVAPLVNWGQHDPIVGIHPKVSFDGKDYMLRLDQIASLMTDHIGKVVGAVSDDDYRIQSAIDRVFASV